MVPATGDRSRDALFAGSTGLRRGAIAKIPGLRPRKDYRSNGNRNRGKILRSAHNK